MKKTPWILACACFLPSLAFANAVALPGPPAAEIARMAPPMPPVPPEHNPHPPQSAADKRRVDFAVLEIKTYYGPGTEIQHPHIIPWSMEGFLKNRQNPTAQASQEPEIIVEAHSGNLAEAATRPPASNMGPALQSDEYMVHVYARFKGDPAWYHLDVILTEDAGGKLTRRRFFRVPMPPVHSQLPPGVVC